MHAAPLPRRDAAAHAIGAVRYFAAEQTIYIEGDAAAHFMLVIDGLVRCCNRFSDGRRFIGAFYATGEIFGVERVATYQASAEAVRATAVVFYPARDAVAPGRAQDGLPGQVLGAMMRCMDQTRGHARLLGRCSAIERLASFLLECSEHATERRLVTLEMTRQDIADYLGLTVETVSRCFGQLKRDGLIEFVSARQVRLLDPAGLARLSV
jgi:CRP/FNR family nitrogen fixation transcriptional regulator